MEISSGYHQAMSNYPPNEVLPVLGYPKPSPPLSQEMLNPRPQEPLRCPRCDSGNTKFCYYNNYSLTQPRYFCKSCRRYWTKGGTLRNVPVGGGCRKNKRSSVFSSTSPVPAAPSNKPAPPQHDFPLAFGFLDILRTGNPAPAAGLPAALHYFGGGDGVNMLPFSNSGGVSSGDSAIMAATQTSNAGRYWNGFFNGFSHEIHDGL